MEELNLQGVTVRKLDDELRAASSWDNCTLVARPGAKECSLQLKCGECTVLFYFSACGRYIKYTVLFHLHAAAVIIAINSKYSTFYVRLQMCVVFSIKKTIDSFMYWHANIHQYKTIN